MRVYISGESREYIEGYLYHVRNNKDGKVVAAFYERKYARFFEREFNRYAKRLEDEKAEQEEGYEV